MPKHVMLNNVEHKDLKVSSRFSQQPGVASGLALTFVTELADMIRDYAIFFRKDSESGEYTCVALLGFNRDENLFLDGDRWDADYVPGVIARGPFLIGFQERQEGGELRRDSVIHLDVEDPRVGTIEGNPVFLENGGNSPYLDRIVSILSGLQDGIAANKAMFEVFTKHDLIEPIKLEVKLDGGQFEVIGLLTISAEKLRNLSSEQLYELHRSGFLQAAYLILASLNNVRRLIERKQRRERAQAEIAS